MVLTLRYMAENWAAAVAAGDNNKGLALSTTISGAQYKDLAFTVKKKQTKRGKLVKWGHTMKVVQAGTQKEMETRTCMATRGCSWEDCRTNEREVSQMRTTENVNGSSKSVIIKTVKGINGGQVIESVSCHQSLYPYLLYYCHSVPKVRVYEADIVDVDTKAKINHGVAVCHIDTSAWGPEHGAFLALGSSPGKIEVCH